MTSLTNSKQVFIVKTPHGYLGKSDGDWGPRHSTEQTPLQATRYNRFLCAREAICSYAGEYDAGCKIITATFTETIVFDD